MTDVKVKEDGSEEKKSKEPEETTTTTTLPAAKPWYTSKTLWVNIVAVGASYITDAYGIKVDARLQIIALCILNAILRSITKRPIEWGLLSQ